MFRKSTLLAVAASAALGLALLAPSAASARGFGGGHMGGGHGGTHFAGGHGMHGGGNFRGGNFRRVGHNHHWHRHYVRWHRPYLYGYTGYATYGVARPAVAAGPCTCLSKEYTPEGAVLFKDNCTNEAAMNPPAPQQTGELQPDQQPSYPPRGPIK